ncbi:ATP-binding protein [Plantactinospora veratri]
MQVSGQLVANGYAVEIEDRGLGMSSEDRAAANERIATQHEFTLTGGAAQLGLYVVSRLTERHGVRVRLKESPYGGTTAVVLLPLNLITDRSAEGEPAAGAMPVERLAASAIGGSVRRPPVRELDRLPERESAGPSGWEPGRESVQRTGRESGADPAQESRRGPEWPSAGGSFGTPGRPPGAPPKPDLAPPAPDLVPRNPDLPPLGLDRTSARPEVGAAAPDATAFPRSATRLGPASGPSEQAPAPSDVASPGARPVPGSAPAAGAGASAPTGSPPPPAGPGRVSGSASLTPSGLPVRVRQANLAAPLRNGDDRPEPEPAEEQAPVLLNRSAG